ncbi:phytanoyl-CoA dioxygenase family protein [Ramlibacter albus]|uniref:Phytanoyl-CoA dioxygenase family protein n=1 Tax=Ramlibacter albus TaxID=2079448 RepID=A0A923M729_9BURK|nr:phytanoyl-CoA dioxygenase family protein [Ramlibacter albus]MBC5764560.1 phytanoyl-CoA dioxygenase family protein [Ramlibacter albus]
MQQVRDRVLTRHEVHHYHAEGWLRPAFRLPHDRIAALRSAVERFLGSNPGVRPESFAVAHVEGLTDDAAVALADIGHDDDILQLASEVLGQHAVLHGCQLFCKPPGDGYETPWHQDGQYWSSRPRASCTVWVAVEDSDRGNGCLRVIPGSHRAKRLYEHLHEERSDLTVRRRLASSSFDESAALDVELFAGELSLHDMFTIHGARPNRSGRRRTGVALRFMAGLG